MIKLFRCASIVFGVTLVALAQTGIAAGGPDAYGYTFVTSADIGGPAADWIDISASGTLVSGLADDNSAVAIALPKPFLYYATHLGSLKVGSNGWVAFNNVSNIAACFPTIPQAGGPDGYLAPYMSDLNFTGAGNPGKVRTYYDAGNEQFIVSYINVPYWTVNSPGWTGSNSFQIVLGFADNSIRFNYLALGAIPQNASCNDDAVGIESPLGDAGLEYVQDANVPAPFSIVFSSGKYEIGGVVSGLAGGGLTLQLNGTDDLPISADGSFAFPQLLTGGNYSVTVSTPPSSPFQVCSVANGSGTVNNANVENIQVTCVTGPESTTTTVLSDNPNSAYGQAVTFTATVAGTFAQPTGAVTFYDNNVQLGCTNPAPLDTSDPPKATCTTSTLDAGTHSIRASYSGDANNQASEDTLTQQVAQSSTTTAIGTACMLTFVSGQDFTMNASVTGIGPAGDLTFLSGGSAVLCANTPLVSGSASCTTSALSVPTGGGDGIYYLSATYSGDNNNAGSVSNTLTINVLDPDGVVFRNDFEDVPPACPVE
jgi:hypothetical protein